MMFVSFFGGRGVMMSRVCFVCFIDDIVVYGVVVNYNLLTLVFCCYGE